jgi:hypothetical protein
MTHRVDPDLSERFEPEWQAQEEARLRERSAGTSEQDTIGVKQYRLIARELDKPLNIEAPQSLTRLICTVVETETRRQGRLLGLFDVYALAGLVFLSGVGLAWYSNPVTAALIEVARLSMVRVGQPVVPWALALMACLALVLVTTAMPRRWSPLRQ